MTGLIRLTENRTLEVKCSPVSFPGFEDCKFFLHRAVHEWLSFDNPHMEPNTSNTWKVTEKSTGCSIMGNRHSGKTKAEAIAIARENLENNREKFYTYIKNAEKVTQ